MASTISTMAFPSNHIFRVLLLALVLIGHVSVSSFMVSKNRFAVISCHRTEHRTELQRYSTTTRLMAQVSEKEAKAGIDKVVNSLRRDKTAKEELGNLVSVNNVLGFGSPSPGILAVRFNASFRKGGMGRSSVPLPFGLGQSNESEGRGTMVGQVKASLDIKSGKLINCSVFRDLGYGRAFNLKV
jgi:hypothetical protein